MRKYSKYKRQMTPPPVRHVFLFTVIFFVISTFFSIWMINSKVEPILMNYAEMRTRQFTRMAINEAVSKKIAEDLQYEQLIQEKIDNDGNVVSIGWNSVVTNRVVRNTTYRVQNFLRQLEEGNLPVPGSTLDVDLEMEENSSIESITKDPTVIRIPIGQALGIPILANLGPEIPVSLEIMGDVQSEVVMDREELGINTIFFELYVQLDVSMRVIVPFETKLSTISQKIKIDDRVVGFDVPNFYNNGGESNNPTFSIPIDPLQ